MIVTVSGWSGLTKAYRSELSATGSLLISGASRCDDMSGLPGGFEQARGQLLVGDGLQRVAREEVDGALLGVADRDDERRAVAGGLGLAGQAQTGDRDRPHADAGRGEAENPAAGQPHTSLVAVAGTTHAGPFVGELRGDRTGNACRRPSVRDPQPCGSNV